MIPLSIVFTTFCLLFVSELPDKTSIATLVLATKYRVRDVVLGAWAAFLVQAVIGVAAGAFLPCCQSSPYE